jgi:hypothetical protein
MFSNEELRTAMGGLVNKVGEDHTSFSRYADPVTGKGACFLGALCEHMGLAVPAEGVSAAAVLGANNISDEMGRAFQVAQYLNDQRFEWKYVLLGVDLMLGKGDAGEYSAKGCPCGCNIPMGTIAEVVDEVKMARMRDQSLMPKIEVPTVPGFKASGGTINGMSAASFGQVVINIDSMSESIYSLQAATNSFITTFLSNATVTNTNAQKVAVKQDHALVA